MTEPLDVETTLREHLTECAALRVETNKELRALQQGHSAIMDKLDGFNRSAWKAVGTIAMAVFVAALGLFVQGYKSHQETIDTTTTTAAALARYTAQDAARDRATQDAVNKKILDDLAKLSKGRR